MSLNLALGIGCLRDAVGEGDVDRVELAPHLIGRHCQQGLDVVPQPGRDCAVALGAEDVGVCELGPCLWHCDSGRGKEKPR